ncbi:MAG: hypothetical protein ABIQ01_04985 [Pseudolysinimonas sp.]
MSTIRNPVGRQSPSVYWRRRLLVLLGVIAVIVVIVLIVVRPGGTPTANPTNSASPSGLPSGSPSPSFTSAAGGEACNPSQIAIAPITDSNSYAAGVQPALSMSVTNIGSAPCAFDVGTASQEYIITSGTDRIWSSKDCQTAAAANPQVLAPGVELKTTPFPWDRTRSSTTTCNTTRPAAVSGPDGPTYKLQVKLGDLESTELAFRLF